MLTIKECREILAEDAIGLSDRQITEMREWLTMMADIVIRTIEDSYRKNVPE